MKTLIQKLLGASFLLIELTAFSQETRFFMPFEIQQAYEKGTRSYDGKPGKNYWQNTADYKIAVSIDPVEKTISGQEEIIYYNNSKESIGSLVMRLYYDVYKKGNSRAAALQARDIGDGVEITGLKINNKSIDVEKGIRREGTNMICRLTEILKQGDSIKIETSWKQKIPYTNRRTGVYDSTTFFIANWYPQL